MKRINMNFDETKQEYRLIYMTEIDSCGNIKVAEIANLAVRECTKSFTDSEYERGAWGKNAQAIVSTDSKVNKVVLTFKVSQFNMKNAPAELPELNIGNVDG